MFKNDVLAVYAGTFDPFTNGHLDITMRASKMFKQLIVAVAMHSGKDAMFSVDERKDMIERAIVDIGSDAGNISVMVFDGLLVEFMTSVNAGVIVRGIRAASDFEYEFQMSCMNIRLNPNIETVFLPAKDDMHFISSRMIKSVAQLGGDISSFVPKNVAERLR